MPGEKKLAKNLRCCFGAESCTDELPSAPSARYEIRDANRAHSRNSMRRMLVDAWIRPTEKKFANNLRCCLVQKIAPMKWASPATALEKSAGTAALRATSSPKYLRLATWNG